MAALTYYAEKLLAWFEMYNVSATVYDDYLTNRYPKVVRRGVFTAALEELVYYGY